MKWVPPNEINDRIPPNEKYTRFYVWNLYGDEWRRLVTLIGGYPCGHPPYVKPVLPDGEEDGCGVYGGWEGEECRTSQSMLFGGFRKMLIHPPWLLPPTDPIRINGQTIF